MVVKTVKDERSEVVDIFPPYSSAAVKTRDVPEGGSTFPTRPYLERRESKTTEPPGSSGGFPPAGKEIADARNARSRGKKVRAFSAPSRIGQQI